VVVVFLNSPRTTSASSSRCQRSLASRALPLGDNNIHQVSRVKLFSTSTISKCLVLLRDSEEEVSNLNYEENKIIVSYSFEWFAPIFNELKHANNNY